MRNLRREIQKIVTTRQRKNVLVYSLVIWRRGEGVFGPAPRPGVWLIYEICMKARTCCPTERKRWWRRKKRQKTGASETHR